MQDKILKALKSYGYQAQFTSADHAKDLKREIMEHLKKGHIDKGLYNSYLQFDFEFKKLDFTPESILIVADKMPITVVDFALDDKVIPLVIPPTYVLGAKLEKLKNTINKIASSYNIRANSCRLPTKLLAVRSGLSQYGRNNISYIPDMGSFYRLAVFATNINITNDNWNDIKVMDSCKECNICIDNCPTKCIRQDSDIIDASKCLTYFNEQNATFPSWINPAWHNSLVGCMECQITCPKNSEFINNIDKSVQFTSNETKAILSDLSYDKLDNNIKTKLHKIESDLFYDNFKRNLKVLINKNKSQ